jgi:CTP:molybdopterin cytidylyltransferase MocA
MADDAESVDRDHEQVAPERVVIVVLAGGAGTRFTGVGHKLTAVLEGRSVLERSVGAALASGAGPVVIVTGAVQPTLPAAMSASEDVHVVHNPDWEDGQSTSLMVGIAAADRLGADAIVVGLGDQPFIEPEAWRLVAESTSPIAVATYSGERRNPVRLHRDVWALIPTRGDEGARSLIRARGDLVHEVPCPGSPADIDTLEDLRTWQNRSSTNSP